MLSDIFSCRFTCLMRPWAVPDFLAAALGKRHTPSISKYLLVDQLISVCISRIYCRLVTCLDSGWIHVDSALSAGNPGQPWTWASRRTSRRLSAHRRHRGAPTPGDFAVKICESNSSFIDIYGYDSMNFQLYMFHWYSIMILNITYDWSLISLIFIDIQ